MAIGNRWIIEPRSYRGSQSHFMVALTILCAFMVSFNYFRRQQQSALRWPFLVCAIGWLARLFSSTGNRFKWLTQRRNYFSPKKCS